jgi:hypothetical protein
MLAPAENQETSSFAADDDAGAARRPSRRISPSRANRALPCKVALAAGS